MKFTDEEVDTLIEILNEEVGVRFEDDTFDEYYDKAADLTQAITQLHFNNEIEHPDVREKVKAVVEKILEQRIGDENAEYLEILIKLETQEETDKE